ncbi:MAG: hypothetical protein Q4B28_05385, partial [bacterium]|nr:hypothetical protein [bacterium]
ALQSSQDALQSLQTFSLDALEAMSPQTPIASEAQINPQEGQAVANPQMLSLDEMIAQPNVNT